jgi:DNA-binding NtrC family response regulator
VPAPFAEAVWPDSYEADQHLLHLGRSDTCVCWTLCGFASGYLSYANGRTIYCLEETCRGRGDAVCRMVGRPREEWAATSSAEFAFYESDCLQEGLKKLQQALKRVDRKFAQRRAQLDQEDVSGLVARSEPMKLVLAQASRVAAVDTTLLLLGESGVGKERVARFIHEHSRRQTGPFVAINCAAVPESLLESELFGHARGAFTGAVSERAGLFEAARGGTLLLDEIGEIPAVMQAKLLRVLQEREVRRLGENKERAIDVRVIAATHRDLAAEVKAGRFREDLYFRLRVIELKVPPLRERVEDIAPLVRLALHSAVERARLPPRELSQAALRAVLDYRWPGNVRELFNAIERAVVLSVGKKIEVDDLPEELRHPARAHQGGPSRTLADIERDVILSTLSQEHGNRARSAARLGIGQATLFRKIKQYQRDGILVAPAA